MSTSLFRSVLSTVSVFSILEPLAITCLMIALIAAVLGFGGIASGKTYGNTLKYVILLRLLTR